MLDKHIGPHVNLTPERVVKPVSKAYYDGPKRLRSAIAWIGRIPVLGAVFTFVITPFFMLETRAVRTSIHR